MTLTKNHPLSESIQTHSVIALSVLVPEDINSHFQDICNDDNIMPFNFKFGWELSTLIPKKRFLQHVMEYHSDLYQLNAENNEEPLDEEPLTDYQKSLIDKMINNIESLPDDVYIDIES